MTEALVFRRVRAIDPAGALDAEVDVVVERGRITRVGPGRGEGPRPRGRARPRRRDAGAWLLPGLVDLHAHLREPGAEGKEDVASGLRAAAAGRLRRRLLHAEHAPGQRLARRHRDARRARPARSAACACTPSAPSPSGQKGEQLTEMADLKDAGAVAVSDDGRCVTSSQVMRRALEYAATFDLPVIQHAEDHALTEGAQMHEGAVSTRLGLRGWPRVAEDVIVARDVLLAEYVGARYHVAHVSTLGAARLVREGRRAASRSRPRSRRTTCCSPTRRCSATTPRAR